MSKSKRANNEGSLSKRSDGRWEARITLEGGKRKSLYGATRAEVARKLADKTRDRDKGIPIPSDRETAEHYLRGWLETARPTIRPRTYERYEGLLRIHAFPSIGKVSLSKVGPRHLQDLYARCLTKGQAPASVHQLHAVLHRAFGQAVKLELIYRNPVDAVDAPRPAGHQVNPLSQDEAARLLDAAASDRLHGLYVLAITTGMRQGELLGLNWSDVDWDNAAVYVRHQVGRGRTTGILFSQPKTAKSRRKIALPAFAVDALRQHRKAQLEERLRAGEAWKDQGLVFPNTVGRPIEARNLLRRSFFKLLEKADLPRIRFHDLRHTAATLLLKLGTHPKVVQERLGHSQIGITMDIYSHVLPDMQHEAAAGLDAMLNRSGLASRLASGSGEGSNA